MLINELVAKDASPPLRRGPWERQQRVDCGRRDLWQNPSMERLREMLETLSRLRPEGSAWCGSAPANGSAEELAEKIVSRPASADIGDVDREDAVVWLSLLAAHSLNHGIGRESAAPLLAKVEAGFSDLGENARFFSVGRWEISRRGKHWEPLRADHRWLERRYHVNFSGPHSTGEGVVGAIMGFDQVSAFLFAVAEDD